MAMTAMNMVNGGGGGVPSWLGIVTGTTISSVTDVSVTSDKVSAKATTTYTSSAKYDYVCIPLIGFTPGQSITATVKIKNTGSGGGGSSYFDAGAGVLSSAPDNTSAGTLYNTRNVPNGATTTLTLTGTANSQGYAWFAIGYYNSNHAFEIADLSVT